MQRYILLSLALFIAGCCAKPDVSHLVNSEYLPPNSEPQNLENSQATIYTGSDLNAETPVTSLAEIPLQKSQNQHAQIESIQPSINVASFTVQTTIPLPQTYSQPQQQQQTYNQLQQFGDAASGNYNSPQTYNSDSVTVEAPASAQANYSYTPPAPQQPVQEKYMYNPPMQVQENSQPISAPIQVQAQEQVQDSYRYNSPVHTQQKYEQVQSAPAAPQIIQDNYSYTPPTKIQTVQENTPSFVPVPAPQPLQENYSYTPPAPVPQRLENVQSSALVPASLPIQDNYSYTPPAQIQKVDENIPAPAPQVVHDNYRYTPPAQVSHRHVDAPSFIPATATQHIQDNYSYKPPVHTKQRHEIVQGPPLQDNYNYSPPQQRHEPASSIPPQVQVPQQTQEPYRYAQPVQAHKSPQLAPISTSQPSQELTQDNYSYTPPAQTQQRQEPVFVPNPRPAEQPIQDSNRYLPPPAIQFQHKQENAPFSPAPQVHRPIQQLVQQPIPETYQYTQPIQSQQRIEPVQQQPPPTQNYVPPPRNQLSFSAPTAPKQTYLPPAPIQQNNVAPVKQHYLPPQTYIRPQQTAVKTEAFELLPQQTYLPPAPAQVQKIQLPQQVSQAPLQTFVQPAVNPTPSVAYNYRPAEPPRTIPVQQSYSAPPPPAPVANYQPQQISQPGYNYRSPQTYTTQQQQISTPQLAAPQPVIQHQTPVGNFYNYKPASTISKSAQQSQNFQFVATTASVSEKSVAHLQSIPAASIQSPVPNFPQNDGFYNNKVPSSAGTSYQTAPSLPRVAETQPSFLFKTEPSFAAVPIQNTQQQGTEYAQNGGYVYRRTL